MNKKRAVVFGFTSNMTFAVASVMMDVRRHCLGQFDEVVCLHDGGITQRDMKLMAQILPVRFIKYDCPFTDLTHFDQGTIGYFSHMVLSKYECLRLLDEYSMVIFLDYDIVLTSPMDEVFSPAPGGIKMILDGSVKTQLHVKYHSEAIPGINMNGTGMCASLFALEDCIPYREMLSYVYDITEKYASRLYAPEQFGFSMMLQKFDCKKVMNLDSNDFTLHPRDISTNPAARILHAYGQPKFWNGFYNRQWEENYAQWKAMGGTPYKKMTILDKIMKRWRKLQASLSSQ